MLTLSGRVGPVSIEGGVQEYGGVLWTDTLCPTLSFHKVRKERMCPGRSNRDYGLTTHTLPCFCTLLVLNMHKTELAKAIKVLETRLIIFNIILV